MNTKLIVKHAVVLFITLFVVIFSVMAKETVIDGGNYSVRFVYNETVSPGDPVFVRMTIAKSAKIPEPRTGTQAALLASATTARLVFGANTAADFYPVPGKSADTASSADFLAAIPLGTFQKLGTAQLDVTYAPFGTGSVKATLPFTIVARHFNSETLKLSAGNTATLTDPSPERAAQSEKLNKIVLTRNRTHVYQLTPFAKPVIYTRQSSWFGDRRVYNYSDGRTNTDVHWGNDYAVPTGTRVGACAAGRVVLAELRNLTGWSVMIEHLPGLYSHYYHMDSLIVQEGDMVKQGDQIGYSGSTGFSTGPHLHWELRLNAVAVHPDFFTKDFAFLDD